MNQIFKIIEDLSLPIVMVLLSELFIFLIVIIALNRITAHSIKEISKSVNKLDECVKIVEEELDDVAEAIHHSHK